MNDWLPGDIDGKAMQDFLHDLVKANQKAKHEPIDISAVIDQIKKQNSSTPLMSTVPSSFLAKSSGQSGSGFLIQEHLSWPLWTMNSRLSLRKSL